MKTPSLTIKLFLKTEQVLKDGTCTIYARLRLGKEKMELTTNKMVKPGQWNANGFVIKNSDAIQINQYLDAFKSKIHNVYSQLFVAQQEITLPAIKSLLLGKPVNSSHTLIQLAIEHDEYFRNMVGVKYSQGSYKNYKTTLKYLIEFVPGAMGKKDIPLSAVNYKFCEAFFLFLTTRKKCHVNGANKQLQRLKKILNYGIKLGYIQTNPMASYTLKFEPTSKVALTLKELDTLLKLEFQRPTLSQVRDVFLIQCFTGLPYSDIKRLSGIHISPGHNGKSWIRMNRQKTNIPFSVPILDSAMGILEKYMINLSPETPILPILSNQKMNDNLKVIQELADINKSLTTHLARHTFATLALNYGVPISSVKQMMGHTKITTTQAYARVLDSTIEKDMERLNKLFEDKLQ